MAEAKLPATAYALPVFIAFALLALIGLVIGLGRWDTGSTWATVLGLGIVVVAIVILGVRRNSGGLAREP